MTENSPYYADWYEYAREELDMAKVALEKGTVLVVILSLAVIGLVAAVEWVK